MRPHRATPIDQSPQVRPRPLRRRNDLPYLRPRRLLTSPLSFVNSGLPPARRGGAHRRLVEPVFRLGTCRHQRLRLLLPTILLKTAPVVQHDAVVAFPVHVGVDHSSILSGKETLCFATVAPQNPSALPQAVTPIRAIAVSTAREAVIAQLYCRGICSALRRATSRHDAGGLEA